MAAIATRKEIAQRRLKGDGIDIPLICSTNGTPTTAVAGSGFFTNTLNFNSIGSTVPTTLVGFQLPPGTQDLRIVDFTTCLPAADSVWLGHLYRFGTAILHATGNQFTHDGTFTRLYRTQFGSANSPITMIPLIYMTATSAGSNAPVFTFNYADQDGNATVGNVNFTMPATNTALQSCYTLMLNDDDSAVMDVTQVSVGVSAAVSSQTVSVFGFEPIATGHSTVAGELSFDDAVFSPPNLHYLRPAVPDSGSVTSYLALLCPSNLGATVGTFVLSGVDNT